VKRTKALRNDAVIEVAPQCDVGQITALADAVIYEFRWLVCVLPRTSTQIR